MNYFRISIYVVAGLGAWVAGRYGLASILQVLCGLGVGLAYTAIVALALHSIRELKYISWRRR
jgi:hypothetical protein